MRSAAADRAIVLALIGLVAASIWLKSVAGPSAPPPRGLLDRAIAARLTAQGFAVRQRRTPAGYIVIDAKRGPCTLLARNAAPALGMEAAFSRLAADVGPVVYLYGGRAYPAPPVVPMRIDRLRREARRLIGVHVPVRVPVALAASPPCGDGLFDLAEIDAPA